MTALFETPRLLVRPYTMDDLADEHAKVSHPDYWKFDPGYERSLEESARWLAIRIAEYNRHQMGKLAVVFKANNRLVGHVGLQLFMMEFMTGAQIKDAAQVELFYGLHPAYWGQGLMTEAARAMAEYGFEHYHIQQIVSTALKANTRSVGLMTRIGMVLRDEPGNPEQWVVGVLEKNKSNTKA